MDLQDVHNRIALLTNKDINFWPKPIIDRALDMAQMWKYAEAFKRYAVDQQAQDDLAPFKVKFTFTVGNTPAGLMTFASDYMHFLALYVQYVDAPTGFIRTISADLINEDELGDRLNSQLTTVALLSPIINIPTKGQVQLYPQLHLRKSLIQVHPVLFLLTAVLH